MKASMSSAGRDVSGPATRKRSIARWLLLSMLGLALTSLACQPVPREARPEVDEPRIQLGPRPFHLLDRLEAGPLKTRLEACREGPFRSARFSIGHRGAPLQFPEHTRASYLAAARMGAGLVECDVTFTSDRELVCRHSQCDLHTSTNILETPLAARCREGFTPAEIDGETGELLRPASALCCTSELTLEEFKSLEGRMDAADPRATTLAAYLDATPSWRTDLYATGGELMSHDESLALFRRLGVGMTPELKAPMVEMPFQGDYTQRSYALQLLDAYREAGIPARDVRLQSFDPEDVRVWLEAAPEFGARAIWLDPRSPRDATPSVEELQALHAEGFRTIAPPMSMLLALQADGSLGASEYARRARAAGLSLVTWTAERSGRVRDGRVEGRDRDFYLSPGLPTLQRDGDVLRVIHALVERAGIEGLFSDWPATTTFYANCMGLD